MSEPSHQPASELHWTVRDAIAGLPLSTQGALRFAKIWQSGVVSLELYAPQEHDAQQPHDSDEFYIIIEGTGWFVNGSHRHTFAPGDVIFVPAFTPHRFEYFSEDFKTWVIFISSPHSS